MKLSLQRDLRCPMDARDSNTKSIWFPALAVLCTAGASLAAYESSARIASGAAQEMIAHIAGTVYFISVALAPLYVYTAAYLRGAPPRLRFAAALLTPFVWMTKECLVLSESHPLVECLYYYLNPLNVWFCFLIALELSLATLAARFLLRRRGVAVRVLSAGPLCTMAISLCLCAGIFAWGRGENLYVLFLEGYRALFGSGV